MNNVNQPTNVTVTVPLDAMIKAAEQGNLENVSNIKKGDKSLVIETAQGKKVEVAYEGLVSIDKPDASANTDMLQLQNTVNKKVNPNEDAQATFSMAALISLLFEEEQQGWKSSVLNINTDLAGQMTSIMTQISDLKTGAVFQLVAGCLFGAAQIGGGALSMISPVMGAKAANKTTVTETVNVEADVNVAGAGEGVVPQQNVQAEGNVFDNIEQLDLEEGEELLPNQIKPGVESEDAKAPETRKRKATMSDKEWQTTYDKYVTMGRGAAELAQGTGQIGKGVNEFISTIYQTKSKEQEQIQAQFAANQQLMMAWMNQLVSLLNSLVSIIQQTGSSDASAMGTIASGMRA